MGDPPEGHTAQDKNAGNLGDLLKHYWLLTLIERVIRVSKPRKVAYLESHAGAGWFQLSEPRIRKLAEQKLRVCPHSEHWKVFDRYNARIREGVYLGSFALALHRLDDWKCEAPERELKVVLWESDQEAVSRIKKHWSELIPDTLLGVTLREEESTPELVTQKALGLREKGFKVIWFCDPYWGKSKGEDRVWWALLDKQLSDTFGIIFACVGGNSAKRGSAKFDFIKTIGARDRPWRPTEENVRAYGLYLTKAAQELLS